jgi:hypothetical protein
LTVAIVLLCITILGQQALHAHERQKFVNKIMAGSYAQYEQTRTLAEREKTRALKNTANMEANENLIPQEDLNVLGGIG